LTKLGVEQEENANVLLKTVVILGDVIKYWIHRIPVLEKNGMHTILFLRKLAVPMVSITA
jgi:hypothetical protein